MKEYYYQAQVMWSQIDANQHMRHSAYADFAAQARMAFLESVELTSTIFFKNNRGPILFREELTYLKEIKMNEHISISCQLIKCRADGSKWSIKHELFNSKKQLCAIIVVDGAWIDLAKRKMAYLPESILPKFMEIPKSEDFIMD